MKAEERHTVPHKTAIKLEPGDKIVLVDDISVTVDRIEPQPYGIVRIFYTKLSCITAGRRYVFKIVRDKTPVEHIS